MAEPAIPMTDRGMETMPRSRRRRACPIGPAFMSRVPPTAAKGCPAFGQYHADPPRGRSPHLLEVGGERVRAVRAFLDTGRIFPLFELPARLPA